MVTSSTSSSPSLSLASLVLSQGKLCHCYRMKKAWITALSCAAQGIVSDQGQSWHKCDLRAYCTEVQYGSFGVCIAFVDPGRRAPCTGLSNPPHIFVAVL